MEALPLWAAAGEIIPRVSVERSMGNHEQLLLLAVGGDIVPAQAGRDPLLHPYQDGDVALAVGHQGRRAIRHPDHAVRWVKSERRMTCCGIGD